MHYVWAGLDFMFDEEDRPVFLEANRASHMLGEYASLIGDERPFAITAALMESSAGPACLLWRKGEPFPDGDEDAPFIGGHLARHLKSPPHICWVEDNQVERPELLTREGAWVRPGSIFRWWYGLPWSYERAGVRVINPNCAWCAIRDKLLCAETVGGARSFRVPQSFAVGSAADVHGLLRQHDELFHARYVLKPRVGWGGFGVQVADPGEPPRPFEGEFILSERIVPRRRKGLYWDVRAFVMGGEYLGGIQHQSTTPNTNYWQGGRPERLDRETSERLAVAAVEAVALLDAEADRIHRLPEPPRTDLTIVDYQTKVLRRPAGQD